MNTCSTEVCEYLYNVWTGKSETQGLTVQWILDSDTMVTKTAIQEKGVNPLQGFRQMIAKLSHISVVCRC